MTLSKLHGQVVLIVDDDFELRSALAQDFKKRGCDVLLASNGLEAIDFIRNQKIDIVISDVRMPKCGGMELITLIRSVYQRLPTILFLTGFSDLSSEEAVAMGAIGMIEKPIDRVLMISILENAI